MQCSCGKTMTTYDEVNWCPICGSLYDKVEHVSLHPKSYLSGNVPISWEKATISNLPPANIEVLWMYENKTCVVDSLDLENTIDDIKYILSGGRKNNERGKLLYWAYIQKPRIE